MAKKSSKSGTTGSNSDSLPTSPKKFRKSPEIESFYRFVYENGLQREAFEILEQVIQRRRLAKTAQKQKR